jgi:hypothetical protein
VLGAPSTVWDDLARNAFVRSPHTHHRYDVHFELKVSHGNSNMKSRPPFPPD